MRLLKENSMAFVIDMQEKLVPAMFNSEAITERTQMLLHGMRELEIPILLSQQYTKGLGSSLPEIYEAAGSSRYFDKRSFSCWDDDDIRGAIQAQGRENVIIAGTEAHVCVLQTCIDLKAAGLNPVLVTDCIGSRKENDWNYGVQRAIQEGVTVTTAEAVLFELLRSSTSPHFKFISDLVK